jgi:hypothetical protein
MADATETTYRLTPALFDLIALAFDEHFNALDDDNSRHTRIVAQPASSPSGELTRAFQNTIRMKLRRS